MALTWGTRASSAGGLRCRNASRPGGEQITQTGEGEGNRAPGAGGVSREVGACCGLSRTGLAEGCWGRLQVLGSSHSVGIIC